MVGFIKHHPLNDGKLSNLLISIAKSKVFSVGLHHPNSGQIEYGSPIQERVCQSVGIPNQCLEDFWNSKGHEAVEEAIRRKRNTLTNSLKQRFVQYCKKPDRDGNEVPVYPPNPMKMIPLGVLRGK